MSNRKENAGTLAALKAVRQFIVNGVELGFIRMPDADTPDPAHDTLPMIEGAIAELEAQASTQRDGVVLSGTEMVSVPRADIDLLVSCQQGTYVAPEGESCIDTGLKVFRASERLEQSLAQSASKLQGESVAPVVKTGLYGYDETTERADFEAACAKVGLKVTKNEYGSYTGDFYATFLGWNARAKKAAEMSEGAKAPAPTIEEPRTYADEPLSRIKAMGALVQDARGINISGDTRKVSAFLLCGAAVPDLVAHIEELEAR